MMAATALGFPGQAVEDATGQPPQSALPPGGADESAADRIARLEREIVRAVALSERVPAPATLLTASRSRRPRRRVASTWGTR